jgi:Right handed beta helix region
MKAKSLVVAATVVLGLGVCAGQATAQDKIQKCGPITSPGSYVLGNNLTSTDECLVIQADFVTIDLGGFLIRRLLVRDAGDAHGITDRNVARRGITIRNGTIRNFTNGIHLVLSSDILIERVSLLDNTDSGIDAGPGTVVRDCIVTGNGSQGILLRSEALVTGNLVARNGSEGILLTLGRGNIIGNSVHGNGATGIAATGDGGSFVSNNSSTANGLFGIGVACPSVVLGNTAAFNVLGNINLGDGCTVAHNSPAP